MKNKYILLCLILIFISCKNNKNEISNTTSKQIQVSPEKDFPSSEYTIDVNFIALETSPDYLIGNIQNILVKNNLIYVKSFRDDQILIFEKDGRIKNKLSCQGKGPGEYIEIIDFMIDSDNNIYILDHFGIMKYDSNCEFISKDDCFRKNEEIYPISFYVTQSGYKYFWNSSSSDPYYNKRRDKIFVYDKKGLKGSFFNVNYNHIFAKRFYDYGNKILIQPAKFDYNILKVDNAIISEEYLINFGSFSIPDKYHSETFNVTNTKNISETVAELSVFWNIMFPIETNEYFAFSASKGMDNYQFIYDKKREECYNATYQKNNPLPIWNIRGAIDSCFFSVIHPATLSGYIEKLDKEEQKNLLSKLGDYNFKGNNNPIILTWSISYNE